jgi:prevent-host-death family protein
MTIGAKCIDETTPLRYTLYQDIATSKEGKMSDKAVSIGEVKRDISELVNRVAYGHERIVLTSRGKPKAVLVSLEDYQRLQEQEQVTDRQQWADWLRRADELSRQILQERGGQPLDVDLVVQSAKEELEARHDDLFRS